MALRQGSSGSEVSTLQQLLEDAGFSPGKIDGIFGPKTAAALRAFQTANDLTVDGIYGPKSAAALGGDPQGSDTQADDEESGPRMSLAGDPKLWKVGDKSYIVYITTAADGSEIRLAWLAPDEDIQGFFGPGKAIIYDDEMDALPPDVLADWGTTDDLANMTDDPITTWRNTLEIEARTQPWLLDADYQAMSLMAVLEGRPLSESEIHQTKWYTDNNNRQRQWMSLFHSDPMTAQQNIESGRINTALMLKNMGMNNASEEVINFIADAYAMGDWSQSYFNNQLKAITDPASGVTIDSDLTALMGDTGFDTTQGLEQEVRDLVKRWLGPNFGNWDQDTIAHWAGVLRNDPDAELSLVETLKNQKETLFSGYDRNATYDTIAAPWRNMASNIWGETIDEADPLFHQIINMNDAVEAGKTLTQVGLDRGNAKVSSDIATRMSNSFRSV